MWHDLIGKPIYYAGMSGTVTLGNGEVVHLITVHAAAAAGSFSIFGGPSIVVPAGGAAPNSSPPIFYQFYHTLYVAPFNGSSTIVFTGTDHYFVHTIRQGNV